MRLTATRPARVLTGLALTLAATLTGTAVTGGPAAAACPDGGYYGSPGQRFKSPTSDTVYMVDLAGRARPVTGEAYPRIFRSWAGIRVSALDAQCMFKGPVIDGNDYLAHSTSTSSYYFVEDDARARGIPSVAVYDGYHFNWGTAQPRSQSWLNARPGAPWTL